MAKSQNDLKAAASKYSDRINVYVRRAQYGKAFRVAQAFYSKASGDPLAQYHYAVLLSDNCYGVSNVNLKSRRATTIRMLHKILRKLGSERHCLRSNVLNELFWFREEPEKQWKLGISDIREGDRKGYYSMGVGAAMLSYRSHLAGRRSEALSWARKGERAWLQYFKRSSDYYNAYSFYARCLGFQGKHAKAEGALAKAAFLAKRTLRYPEFQLVRRQIRDALAQFG